MGIKTKLSLLLCLLLLPLAAFGQFDFGPGGAPDTAPWKSFKLSTSKRIKLDFRNASVDAIVSFFSNQSGVSIVKDPALTGTLTVTSAKPVSLNDAFSILSATLDLKGYEVAKKDNLLVIRNKNQGSGRGAGGGGGGMGFPTGFDPSTLFPQPMLKVYPITYANASQLARVINEVFTSNANPLSSLMQMMGGGGGNQGRGGNQQGRNGRFGNQGGGGFNIGALGGGNQPTVHASSDDFSNSVIVNAPSQQQTQVKDLIDRLDKATDDPLKSKVFHLQFASSDDLQAVVQNVLNTTAPRGRGGATTTQTQGPQAFINALRGQTAGSGTVTSDPRTNSLVVSATKDNLDLIGQVITELDTDIKIENAAFVVPLNNAKADLIATLLQQTFGTRTGSNAGGQRATGTNTNTGNRTNTNQNNTGNRNNTGGGNRLGGSLPEQPVAVKDADGKNLDLALQDPNQDMGELMTSIAVQQGGGFRGIFGGGQGTGRTGTSSTQTGRNANGQLVNIRDLTNQITVIPDINTNSLIIVASPDQAELLRSIIEQLDKIPEQVMIETMIVEANLDASTKLGVEWQYINGKNTLGQTFGLQNNTTNPPTGFKYTLAGTNLTAFVNAIQTDTRFTILSTPRIFTSNNTQAQINISQSIPYVLSTIQDANGNLSFNYAFTDVGIILTVTPRITSNGYVTLDVTQTANDLQSFTSFNAPIINQREAQTTVSVKDGETIILGGIIRNTVTTTTNKIPLLGDIPILGNLFKSTSHDKAKTELIVLLTPHVVKNPDDAAKLREQGIRELSPGTQKSIRSGIPTVKGTTTPPPVKKDGGTKPPPPLR